MTDPAPMQFDNPCLGRIVYGQQPVEHLHLGNLLGRILPVIEHQPNYEMIILITDGLASAGNLTRLDWLYETAAGWLAAGLSPNETLLARTSTIPEIEELASLLSPYAVQANTIPTDLYLEACTLIAMQATHVPAHSSQRIVQNLAATIVHQVNEQTHGKLPEPAWLALPEEELTGLNNEAMQAASGNAILLGESEESTMMRLTGLRQGQQSLAVLRSIVDRLPTAPGENRDRSIPPAEYQRWAAEQVNTFLHSLRVKRMKWLAAPSELEGVLKFGSLRARLVVEETLSTLKRAISHT